jgi:hypothetical protein
MASSVQPGVGTFNVGLCAENSSATAINNNDFVEGYVQVTN